MRESTNYALVIIRFRCGEADVQMAWSLPRKVRSTIEDGRIVGLTRQARTEIANINMAVCAICYGAGQLSDMVPAYSIVAEPSREDLKTAADNFEQFRMQYLAGGEDGAA